VDSSIILPGVTVGRYSRVQRAILDAGVQLPEGSVIGEDAGKDRAAGHHVTSTGVVVVSNADATV
jgi:glucose-1-phosphate adenylyltransferase